MKWCSFFALILLAQACGPNGRFQGPLAPQTSKVKPLAPAISLSQSHGDGKYAIFHIKIPLSESSIDPVNSPVDPRGGVARVPILGDLLRMVGQATFNLGTSLGLGNQSLIIAQPIPELDDEVIRSISISRVFFQIDQKDALEPESRGGIFGGLRRFLRGSSKLDFDFIKELKINMRMGHLSKEPESWLPDVIHSDDPRYSAEAASNAGDPAPLEFVSYRRKDKKEAINNNKVGTVLVIYTQEPVKMQQFFRRHEEFKTILKDIVKVGQSLVIEFNKREIDKQKYYFLMSKYASEVSDLKIQKVDECTEDTCMDLKVSNQNLLPMLMTGNLLKIETQMNLAKVPSKSFQLKGYLEFEIKINSPL
mgnify:CR=1 FL=1